MRYPVPPALAPLAQALEQRDQRLDQPLSGQSYTVAGYTETRALDMATATAADIGNFVCTLVADLQERGKLR